MRIGINLQCAYYVTRVLDQSRDVRVTVYRNCQPYYSIVNYIPSLVHLTLIKDFVFGYGLSYDRLSY